MTPITNPSRDEVVRSFQSAVNYFLRCMRARDFVQADKLLMQRYGDHLHSSVTRWCYEQGVTKHERGRLVLADKFKSATSEIVIV